MGCSKSNSKRQFYSTTALQQETRKILNRQANFTLKKTWEKKKSINNKNPELVKEKKNYKDHSRIK